MTSNTADAFKAIVMRMKSREKELSERDLSARHRSKKFIREKGVRGVKSNTNSSHDATNLLEDTNERGAHQSDLRRYHSESACPNQNTQSRFETVLVDGRPFRILVGSSPDDLVAWRLERKLKYPKVGNDMVDGGPTIEIALKDDKWKTPKPIVNTQRISNANDKFNRRTKRKADQFEIPDPLDGNQESLLRKLLHADVDDSSKTILKILRYLADINFAL